MARTNFNSQQIRDGTVSRADLNTNTAGEAVIAKIIAGSGVTLTSTGADAGTGDVTINVTSNGSASVVASSYPDNDPVISWVPNKSSGWGSFIGGVDNFAANEPVYAEINTSSGFVSNLPYATFSSAAVAYSIAGIKSSAKVVKGGTSVCGGYAFECLWGVNTFIAGSSAMCGLMDAGFIYGTLASATNVSGIFIGWDTTDTVSSKIKLYTSNGTAQSAVTTLEAAQLGTNPCFYVQIIVNAGGTKATVTVLDARTGLILFDKFETSTTLPAPQTLLNAVCGVGSAQLDQAAYLNLYRLKVIPNYSFGLLSQRYAIGQSGAGSINQVTVDFGTIPTYGKNFQIADATALTGDKYIFSESPTSDETEMDIVIASGYCKDNGIVTVFCHAYPGPIKGTRKLNYSKG